MPQGPTHLPLCRRFEFARDTFAFANELVCEYEFGGEGSRPRVVARRPRPDYVLRCFVMARAARQFLYHTEFLPNEASLTEPEWRRRVREVLARNPRVPSLPGRREVFPGYAGLREFSRAWEPLLKGECGGAWRSYALRSHWRMVFPVSRQHQERTSAALVEKLAKGLLPIVHLVRFPQLTINHGMLIFGVREAAGLLHFETYDPNASAGPVTLTYERGTKTFTLGANRYWSGGKLNVLEIYRSWWF